MCKKDPLLHIINQPYRSPIKRNRVLFKKSAQFATIASLGAIHRTIKE